MDVRVDITGKRFERLVVLSRTDRKSSQGFRVYWLCRCDCGKIVEVNRCKLTGNKTKSCGCLNQENRRINNYKHGRSHTKEWYSWVGMFYRCYNENNRKFPVYGGRGIAVCNRWSEFESFFEDMGEKPGDEYSIGRINNDGDYEPSNCRWETVEQQADNRQNTVRILFEGEIKTVTEWSKISGIPRATIKARLNRYGWSPERALTTPVRKRMK